MIKNALNISQKHNRNAAFVITVSALADFDGQPGGDGSSTCRSDEDDTLANFSNWGATIEDAAPGVCIRSTWKDGGTNTISGTSMAAPHVAGAAALLAASGLNPAVIRDTIIATDNFNWTDDSNDGTKEPLLDVSDNTYFAPLTVPGEGGGPPVDSSPSVSWVGSLGDNITENVTIQIDATDIEDDDATLTVEWRVDGGAWKTATYNSISSYYEDIWDITGVADGSHTLGAQATDSVPQTGVEATTTVTVGSSSGGAVSSAVVGYSTEGGKNRDKHLNITVTALDGNDSSVSGASISIKLFLDGSLDSTASGITGTDGTLTFSRKSAPSGCYRTDVAADGVDIPEQQVLFCK